MRVSLRDVPEVIECASPCSTGATGHYDARRCDAVGLMLREPPTETGVDRTGIAADAVLRLATAFLHRTTLSYLSNHVYSQSECKGRLFASGNTNQPTSKHHIRLACCVLTAEHHSYRISTHFSFSVNKY